jgi:hypothetical protein
MAVDRQFSSINRAELTIQPGIDDTYFIAMAAKFCGHCRVKIDLMNNINSMHELAQLTGSKEYEIPRIEWIEASEAGEDPSHSAQRKIINDLNVEIKGFPTWFLYKNRKLKELPNSLLNNSNGSAGINELRKFANSN